MLEVSGRYALPLLAAAQAHKEITHNEALIRIDALLHPAVLDRALATPPADPQIDQMWIVGPNPTGAWLQHSGEIALWQEGGWSFLVPKAGLVAWINGDGAHAVFDGSRWRFDAWPMRNVEIGGVTVLSTRQAAVASPIGGELVDVQARAALSQVLVSLRNHGLIEP